MPEQHNTNGQGEAQRFAEAIAIANVPTLLMVRSSPNTIRSSAP